jgi:hypothetical protein
MRALVVPADPEQPVEVIDLDKDGDRLAALQQAVGGFVEVQAHREGDLWLNDSGRIDGQPLNDRATHFAINLSERAKAGEFRGFEDYACIYGDVVVTGPVDDEGEITPVRQDMVDLFKGLEINPHALDDFRMGQELPPVIITEWPNLGGDLDGGIDR